MGNSSSSKITIDLLVQRVQSVRQNLSPKDRRLFNYAKITIAEQEEELNDCEVLIDFEDQDGIRIQSNNNPSNTIYVGYDQDDNPQFVWQNRSFARRAKYFFVNNFRSLLNAVATIGNVLPAIKFY